jgi:D-alanyl-D-alanine carboxypeptidase
MSRVPVRRSIRHQRRGTWTAGIAAASTALTALGADMTVQRQVDGSGLSRQDLLTNHQITTLLLAARAMPSTPEPARSLNGNEVECSWVKRC